MKIGFRIEDKYRHRFAAMLRSADDLEAEGIHLSLECENPDVVIVQEGLLRQSKELRTELATVPKLVYERIGCAPVNANMDTRLLLKSDSVLGWLKETDFVDRQINNKPMIESRYHLTLIDKPDAPTPVAPPTQLTEADLGKIAAIMPIHMQDRYDHLKSLRNGVLRKRPIDVFYAGTMHYASPLVDYHRFGLTQALSQMPHTKSLAATGNVFDRQQFHFLLTQSKIFVSPYGSGAYSWKDFEALFAGCILIKPRSDFITQYGFDIYGPNGYCVQCDPNWHGLEDLIRSLLDDLEAGQAVADRGRDQIYASCDQPSYTADLTRYFRSIASQIK